MNDNLLNNYDLEIILNNTSNEYDLQSAYDGNLYLGVITELPQVFLAIHDTSVAPYSYTGSENIDTTDNRISLNFPLNVNDVVLNPRAYDGAVFEMRSGTDNFSFLPKTIHGGAPTAQFYSPTKVCKFHGDCQIPNMYNKTFVDTLIADMYNDTYTKTEIESTLSAYTNPIDLHNGFYSKAKMSIILDTYYNITEIQANYYDKVAAGSLFPNIYLSNYCYKIEVGDIDNVQSALILNTYTKTEVDTQLTGYTTITCLQRNYMTTLPITETSMNNYATIAFIVDNLYDKNTFG